MWFIYLWSIVLQSFIDFILFVTFVVLLYFKYKAIYPYRIIDRQLYDIWSFIIFRSKTMSAGIRRTAIQGLSHGSKDFLLVAVIIAKQTPRTIKSKNGKV